MEHGELYFPFSGMNRINITWRIYHRQALTMDNATAIYSHNKRGTVGRMSERGDPIYHLISVLGFNWDTRTAVAIQSITTLTTTPRDSQEKRSGNTRCWRLRSSFDGGAWYRFNGVLVSLFSFAQDTGFIIYLPQLGVSNCISTNFRLLGILSVLFSPGSLLNARVRLIWNTIRALLSQWNCCCTVDWLAVATELNRVHCGELLDPLSRPIMFSLALLLRRTHYTCYAAAAPYIREYRFSTTRTVYFISLSTICVALRR